MENMIFRCAICKLPLSNPVVELVDRTKLAFEDTGCDYLPLGHFAIADKLAIGFESGHAVINLDDAINTRHHPDPKRLFGCCGPSGFSGRNTLCANGHEVGTESSDCHTHRGLDFDPACVEMIEELSA